MTAHLIYEDGRRWLRITPADGYAWDEPIAEWKYIINLTEGFASWKHKDGREIRET